jgi:hypothetical protein
MEERVAIMGFEVSVVKLGTSHSIGEGGSVSTTVLVTEFPYLVAAPAVAAFQARM